MANQYRWPTDGKLHSIPYSVHVEHLAARSPNVKPFSQAQVSNGPGQPTSSVTDYVQQQQQAAGGPPPDPAFLQQQAQAQLALGLGNAWDTYSVGQLNNEFGFGDTSNPYNRVRMLEDSYKHQQAGTTNSYAAQGQLYSGAIQNARNSNATGYARGYDALQRQYQGARNQITRGALDRYMQYGAQPGQDLQSILRALGIG